jgi:2-polyprenyl-3-methyl-5-hydroxy-6-metoxy-1,4-benzoquinol methylase
MYERLDFCPSCNSKDFNNYIICKDYLVSGESFAITKCNSCSLLFTNPRPDRANIGKYYKSEDYISHSDSSAGLKNFLYKRVRSIALDSKYHLIKSLGNGKKVLDIGCGTGYFLNKMKTKGYQVSGIEPDPSARKLAEAKLGEKIFADLIELPKTKFDYISLWHVLEHVHDLKEYLQTIRTFLEKEGHLIIAVPNHSSYDQSYYKEFWAAYDVPRHLYHFTKESLQNLVKPIGYKLLKEIPMKFDAYYVSLLSEKYKTGTTNYIKAFNIAQKSNKVGKPNNFSSMIYIFKKTK